MEKRNRYNYPPENPLLRPYVNGKIINIEIKENLYINERYSINNPKLNESNSEIIQEYRKESYCKNLYENALKKLNNPEQIIFSDDFIFHLNLWSLGDLIFVKEKIKKELVFFENEYFKTFKEKPNKQIKKIIEPLYKSYKKYYDLVIKKRERLNEIRNALDETIIDESLSELGPNDVKPGDFNIKEEDNDLLLLQYEGKASIYKKNEIIEEDEKIEKKNKTDKK